MELLKKLGRNSFSTSSSWKTRSRRWKRRRPGSVSTMTPHQCRCVCGLKNSTRTAEEEEKPLLPAMANSHSKSGPASFRPSEPFSPQHKGTFETKGITHSKKAHGVHTTTKFEKRTRSRFPPISSHHIPSPLSQPVHGERSFL